MILCNIHFLCNGRFTDTIFENLNRLTSKPNKSTDLIKNINIINHESTPFDFMYVLNYNICPINEIYPFFTEKESRKFSTNIASIEIYVDNEYKHNGYIAQKGMTKQIHNYFLKILSRLYAKLSTTHQMRNQNAENIHKKKILIMTIYYTFIFYMPFERGTASIGEILLYTLWNTFIGENIEIMPNVLLDVQVLTLPYREFIRRYNAGEYIRIYEPRNNPYQNINQLPE